MDEAEWKRAHHFMKIYVLMLSLLTAAIAAFWMRTQLTEVAWQSLGAVFILMLIALIITGLALKED